MKKRVFALALALMVALALLPMAALAAEDDGSQSSSLQGEGTADDPWQLGSTDVFVEKTGDSTPTVPYYEKLSSGNYKYYLPAGHYRLSDNIDEISITIIGDVTLDLNGKTLTGPSGGPVLVVGGNNAGNLTIQDSSSSPGSVKGSDKAISVNNGSLTLQSGTVSCSATGEYAIEASKGHTVTLRGGTVGGKIHLADNGYGGPTLYAHGGTVSGAVENGGTITRSDGVTTATEFTGEVKNSGSIAWGTYKGAVTNGYTEYHSSLPGSITGGTFYSTVTNNSGTINDGTFYGTVKNDGGTINDGTFYGTVKNDGGTISDSAKVTVSFASDGGSAVTSQSMLKGQKATKPDDPTPPTANDCFGGWYTDANGTTAFDFDNTTITGDITLYAKWQNHTYEWKTENGQYWQKCKDCGHETEKKAVPTIAITGADKVCQTQGYTFTVTVPEGATAVKYGYDFENKGDSGLDMTPNNGSYSATLASSMFENESSFILSAEVTGADGYTVSTSKTVQILSEHTGGTATCAEKAECEVCGQPYGDLAAHDLTHVEAKAATTEAEGNIEYWHCEECGKYFRDEAGKETIELSDTVIEKLTPTPTPAPTAAPTATPAPTTKPATAPHTADEANAILWLALAMMSVMGIAVVGRKKVK